MSFFFSKFEFVIKAGKLFVKTGMLLTLIKKSNTDDIYPVFITLYLFYFFASQHTLEINVARIRHVLIFPFLKAFSVTLIELFCIVLVSYFAICFFCPFFFHNDYAVDIWRKNHTKQNFPFYSCDIPCDINKNFTAYFQRGKWKSSTI